MYAYTRDDDKHGANIYFPLKLLKITNFLHAHPTPENIITGERRESSGQRGSDSITRLGMIKVCHKINVSVDISCFMPG